jgi:ComF family protein
MKLLGSLLDAVFALRCVGCDVALPPARAVTAEALAFCDLCAATCNEPEPGCLVCGQELASIVGEVSRGPCGACLSAPPPYRRARWGYEYGGAVQDAIKRLKFGGREDVAGRLAQAAFRANEVGDGWDAIVPVPLHWWRLARRGFNQATALSHALRAVTRAPVETGWLRRKRATAAQSTLPEPKRDANVRGAFEVPRRDRVRGKAILLVDDVVTTSATTTECARVLRRAGAASVDVWSVARTLA